MLSVSPQSYTGRLGRLKWSALEFIHLDNETSFVVVVCLSVCFCSGEAGLMGVIRIECSHPFLECSRK